MKNTKLRFKKFLSTLLAVAMVFSLFSEVIVVEAADPVPSLSTVLYQRITENTPTGPKFTDTLTIRGMNFENPEVYIGQFSDYSISINTALSSKSQIIIDDQDELKKMAGRSHNIIVYNNGTDQVGDKILFDLTKIPTITNISKSKAYIGDSLDIGGLFADGALDLTTDKLFIAGTEYSFEVVDGEAEAKIDALNANKINIGKTKAPNTPGIGNVAIERIVGGEGKYKIEAVLKNSITVVDRLTGIEIERVDPNTGPRNRRNIVNIYGKEGMAAFDSSMRVFVNGAEGANKGTIIGVDRKVIGLSVELPTSNTSGAANIIITNSIANSEFEIINGFIYQDIGNGLSIDTGGISPNFKKETEDKEVTITGRNIGFFDGTNYDKLTVDAPTVTNPNGYELIKYAVYDILTKDTYKVKYTGKYDGKPVTIIKEISVFVDGEAKIKTDVSISIPTPSFTKSKDTIIVNPANVNLDPNQPKDVDVKIKTTTTVFNETSNVIYYSRNEEYTVPNGFKYIPDEIAPEITSVTPEYGPSNKEVYMTIMGKDFQVFVDGTTPKVIIGDKIIEGKDINNNNLVKVYDNQNNEVDGKKISLGSKIKIKLPAGTTSISGAIDVTVINPSKGQ
ncbi:MAG: Fibronectin type domain protein, partial [Clostridia bacterium]|nr:Fibronectin type domain protein [Clostridia bacterium]